MTVASVLERIGIEPLNQGEILKSWVKVIWPR